MGKEEGKAGRRGRTEGGEGRKVGRTEGWADGRKDQKTPPADQEIRVFERVQEAATAVQKQRLRNNV